MSLYQCTKCGCLENTACSRMAPTGTYMLNNYLRETPHHRAINSYKKILGLGPDEKFTPLCSACSVVWFTEEGAYGKGPMPEPQDKSGQWHGRFRRIFLPKGVYKTDTDGNLVRKDTGEYHKQDERKEEWPCPTTK